MRTLIITYYDQGLKTITIKTFWYNLLNELMARNISDYQLINVEVKPEEVF